MANINIGDFTEFLGFAPCFFSIFALSLCLSERVGAKKHVCQAGPHRCQARHHWCLLVRMACNWHKCHITEVVMLSPKKVQLGKKWRELTNHGATHTLKREKRQKKQHSFNLYVLLSLRMSTKRAHSTNPHLFWCRDMLRRQQNFAVVFESGFFEPSSCRGEPSFCSIPRHIEIANI